MARLILALTLCAAGAVAGSQGAGATSALRPCRVLDYTVTNAYPGMKKARVTYRIYFANNGAVQMYSLLRSSRNGEADHAALLQLQKRYGLEFVNAPPLRIVSYKKRTSDLAVPDKAVDSCGRITHFQ